MSTELRYVDPDRSRGPLGRTYAAYRREAAKANREIPIVQLAPR